MGSYSVGYGLRKKLQLGEKAANLRTNGKSKTKKTGARVLRRGFVHPVNGRQKQRRIELVVTRVRTRLLRFAVVCAEIDCRRKAEKKGKSVCVFLCGETSEREKRSGKNRMYEGGLRC